MPVIEKDLFLENYRHFDKEVVLEIINLFIEEYPERMLTIRKNIDQKDFDQLRFNTHSLKGVIANFIAPDVRALAKSLEMKGTKKDLNNTDELYSELKEKADLMVEELTEISKNYR